jgi:hypothetical protein
MRVACGSGPYLMTGFGNTTVEPLGFTTRGVDLLKACIGLFSACALWMFF